MYRMSISSCLTTFIAIKGIDIMKLSNILSACILIVSAITGTSVLAEQPTNSSGIAGVWKNINSSTSGITQVAIYQAGNNINFRSWGSCHPTDCVHTTVRGYPYSSGVSSNTAVGLYAYRNSGFAYTRFAASRVGSYLRVTYYTTFAPGDNRKNYTKTEYFIK
jgi:hypothetical protein